MGGGTGLDVLDANRMTQAADIVQGRLTEARGLAVTFASDVEVRIYRTSLTPVADGGSGQGIQNFRLREVEAEDTEDENEPFAVELVPERIEDKLPNSVGISTHHEFSSIWTLHDSTGSTDQGDRPYVAFSFRPDGSTDLAESTSWTPTLVRHPAADPATLSKNFIALGSVLKPPKEEEKVVARRCQGNCRRLMLNKRFQWWGPLRQRLLKKVAS